MRKSSWKITIYFDDEKTKILFSKEYNNTFDLMTDLNLSKTFLYNCCRNDKYKSESRKCKHTNKKYNRLKIIKETFSKDGSSIISSFG